MLRSYAQLLLKWQVYQLKSIFQKFVNLNLTQKLVADSISSQLERRVMFRRAMKRAVQNAMRLGAKRH